MLLLFFLIFKNWSISKMSFISIVIFLTGMLFLPLSFTSIFTFFVLLAIYSDAKNVKLGYFLNKIPQTLIAMPITLLIVAAIYLSARAFYAEYLFSKSVTKLNNNEAVVAYEAVNKAVQINPYADRYHMFSAAINLALAESLAKKTDITDEDKKNISQLIQQSIREGKATVSVNAYKSANWEALSGIYQTIMSFAKGSDNFAIESLTQAISLDPINPNLRIKLGNIYFSLQKYDKAIEVLKLAVLAKPDFANSHYNLAITYKEAKQLDKAKAEMDATLSLIGKESADYDKALKELQDIEELTKPEQTPEPAIEPQIELPQDTTSEVQQ
jgi:tetratricopeptide (TPR) repeat protein